MVNVGVVLLISLAIILTIAVIGLIIWGVVGFIQNINSGGSTGTLQPCAGNVNKSELLQINRETPRCIQNGQETSLYYIGGIENSKYDYVVAPFGTSSFDVCIGFCKGYTGGNCTGPPYNGVTAQENFDRCMTQLSSTTCTPPIPLAVEGAILYYAFSPTCNICDNCG